jgi:murein DD-endopeptidase MepM/ murein hydrolase activator NlpD
MAAAALALTGNAAAQPAPNALLSPVASACISSPFGPRILPGRPKAGTYHYGIDMPAPAGGAVRAAAAGRVVTLRRRGAAGLEVALQHGEPGKGAYTTLYAHLGMVTPALATGKRDVSAGEKLGVVGRSGVTYGTHVYFELQINGIRVDPAPYLGVGLCRKS